MKYKSDYSLYLAFICGIIAIPLVFQSFYSDIAFTNIHDANYWVKLWTLKNYPYMNFNYFHGLWLIPSALMLLFLIDYLNPKLLLKMDILGYIYNYIRKLYIHLTVASKRKKIK